MQATANKEINLNGHETLLLAFLEGAGLLNALLNMPVEIVVGHRLVIEEYLVVEMCAHCGSILDIYPDVDVYLEPVTVTVPLWLVL